jgi:hypothetical protein
MIIYYYFIYFIKNKNILIVASPYLKVQFN